MENTNNVENTVQQTTENTGIIQEPEERKFTQQEVNAIIEKRLKRERERMNALVNGQDPAVVDIQTREKAVTARELRIEAKEQLLNKGLPVELLDVLNYENKESCEASINKLEAIFNKSVADTIDAKLRGGAPMKKAPQDASSYDLDDALAQEFGLKE